ncbi:MAG: GGDEF domain-containing protein [Rhodocyclaceae bacterium]|nr:GGDEF domain-containing protein [Rhodocyclaceae bacterium]
MSYPRWLALLVLLLGLGFDVVLYDFSAELANERQRIYFDFRVREAMDRIESRMATYQQVLRGVAGLFDTSEHVDRQQFREYAERQSLTEHYPGIQGVGYAIAIAPDKLKAHVNAVRAEGYPSYRVRPLGERALYSSVIYLEPFSGPNLRAFGYDMYSEPVRSEAMQRSVDTGGMALSGKVRLQQESGVQEQSGFLIYQAVYHPGRPAGNVKERRAQLRGWVYAPFRMSDFLHGLFGEQGKDLIIDIYDGEEIVPEALMHLDSAERKDMQPGFESVQSLDMMGQIWTLRVRASGSMLERVDSLLPALMLSAGILFSCLLAALVFVLASAKSRAEAAARAMTEDLSLERARLSAILDETRVGTWEWNVQTGETTFNEEWAAMLGYKLAELEPVSIQTWIRLTHPEDLQQSDRLLKQHLAGEIPYYECEARMRHKDGHWIWVLDRGKVGKWDEEGKSLVMYGTHQDITLEKQKLDIYHHGAHHDSLTGLPNRVLLRDRLAQALALAEREKTCVAVMYMDLDGLKSVNDTYGHEAGDVVLQAVARRIQQCIRASDTLARVGGDEFVALLQNACDEDEALRIALMFNSEVRQPIPLPGGAEGLVSLSIGIAIYPQHGTTGDLLSERADSAMYQVKKGAKNGALVYRGKTPE